MVFGCALVCMTHEDNIKSLFSSFRFFHFSIFFFLIWLSAFFCYLQELLILLAAEQKSKSESKQLVMSFQWPISMKLRAKTSRLRQRQPLEFISAGELCSGRRGRGGARVPGLSKRSLALIKKWWQQTYLPPTAPVSGSHLVGKWRREKSRARKKRFHPVVIWLLLSAKGGGIQSGVLTFIGSILFKFLFRPRFQ